MTTLPNNVAPLPIPTDLNGRDGRGRFAKGPGNIGRPRGAVSRQARDLSALLRAIPPAIAVQKLSEAIGNGERWALEAYFRLMLPHGLTIQMHGMDVEDIETATAAGDVSFEQGKAMIATKRDGKAINELDDHRAMMKEILEKLQTR
ncbi:hypothetical protein [Bradyrhizobium japonicum]|uniref:hypothetical protein n=1 Tax=Bradyrhizobium japonicum TaxID=375 RepID=UPI0012FE66E3|nr:hypothetical protein [Bradyrhizobium japonicum]